MSIIMSENLSNNDVSLYSASNQKDSKESKEKHSEAFDDRQFSLRIEDVDDYEWACSSVELWMITNIWSQNNHNNYNFIIF